MKRTDARQPELIELMETFMTEYMPFSKGLSANTIRSHKFTFRLLLQFLYEKRHISADDARFIHLDFDTLNGFMLWVEDERKCSIATRNIRLGALSAFAKYAQNRSIDAALTFMNAVRRIPVKRSAETPRVTFTLDELKVLFRLPDTHSETGLRDKVMLNLMYASGARAQEICDLAVQGIQFQDDVTKLTITGKGNKTRRINIAKPAAALLHEYMLHRGIQDDMSRHVFSSQTHEHMTISCVEAVYKKYVRLGREQYPEMFREKRYSPHTMRHTTASSMLEAGVPIMAIKNFLGHSSVVTTERYAALTQATVNKHIRDWNARWFPQPETDFEAVPSTNRLPSFLA